MVGIINSFNRTFSYALVSAAVEAGLQHVPVAIYCRALSRNTFFLLSLGGVFTLR